MTERENFVMCFQFMSTGEAWTAYEIDAAGKCVVREHKVTAGAALQELIRTNYPKLQVHTNSAAVRRDQGTLVVAKADDLFVEIDMRDKLLKPKNVILRNQKTNHRPLPIKLCADEDLIAQLTWREPSSILVPYSAVELLHKYYPADRKEVIEEWFQTEDLRAYTAVDVYTKGILPFRVLELRSGSHVAVRVYR